jgi:hypothetical protein
MTKALSRIRRSLPGPLGFDTEGTDREYPSWLELRQEDGQRSLSQYRHHTGGEVTRISTPRNGQ